MSSFSFPGQPSAKREKGRARSLTRHSRRNMILH
jgi:hypothetical protein